MKKVAIISLGCAKNLVDSEVMAGYLNNNGYTFVNNAEKADIIIVNTCGFIQPARKESIDALNKSVLLKKEGKARKVLAVGCYVQRYKEFLKEKFPEVDVWLGVNAFDSIVQAVEGKSFDSHKNTFLYDHTSLRIISTPPVWAYVKISEGCSHFCSFCAIPLIKGAYQSRSISSVVKEARQLCDRGIREINLVSQDTTYFGRDKGKKEALSFLLKELLKIKELEWIRILYGYPEEITDFLLEIMQEEKICSYLDIPFQHADPRIIKNMKRGLNGNQALKLIEKIRRKLPSVALRTSIVVGFPGEGRKEFDFLKRFVEEARFDHLGVFTYSREEGTESYSLGNPVKEDIKKKRKEEIMEIQADISKMNNQKYLERKIDVLIEGNCKSNPRFLIGRARFQAPEVDGVVLIDQRKKEAYIGNPMQKVEIIDINSYDLYGRFPK